MFFNDYSELEEFLEKLHNTPAVYSYQLSPHDSISILNSDLNKLEIDAMKLSSSFASAMTKIASKDNSSESSERNRIS